ncbi:MAG: hypothetical protein ACMXX7_01425 [Candidatus Woesearchaeota archaeon]
MHEPQKPIIGMNTNSLLVNISITILLLIFWSPLAFMIIGAALIYMVYRFAALATGGFSCAHCYAKFFLALGLFIFSLGATSGGSVLIPIILLWLNAFIKGTH